MNLQESIRRIKEMMNLNEKLEDIKGTPLYHKTSTSRGLMIIDSDSLIAGKPPYIQLQYDERLKSSKKQKAISFTTEKNWTPKDIENIGTGIPGGLYNLDMTFIVSKDKLKEDYDVEGYNFDDDLPSFLQDGENEYEERVLTDEISPLHKYLMDIIYTGDDSEVQEKIDSYLNR